MDATDLLSDLLANFFPLLGTIVVGGLLLALGLVIIGICIYAVITIVCVLLVILSELFD